jgi:hypothetical protein
VPLRYLLDQLFPRQLPSTDKDLGIPTLGESRPTGHFREFTVSRRRQQGGAPARDRKATPEQCKDGIVPCLGGNIP